MTSYGISVLGADLAATARLAAAADSGGLDAAWASEFMHRSATVSLAAMAAASERCRIGSSIMYGIGRTPLVLAAEARDLDELSGGRLVLGIGNGTKRMQSDWHGIVDPDAPALRLEELVPLVRRLWRLHEGSVEHEGRFYRIALVPTGDVAAPLRTDIPIYAAGVRPRMVEAVGRVADGLIGHPLFTVAYVEQVVRPALAKGAERTGRDPGAIDVASMVICAVDDDDPDRARREARAQLGFYASVGSYASVLDVAGFASAGEAIREAFRRRDLEAMVAAVPDAMVDAMAVAGTSDDVRVGLRRYDGVLDHAILYSPSFQLPQERVERNALALVEACGSDG